MELKVIAYARNGHTDKFGIPRQSREESPIVTRIVFEPEYAVREALRGIEGFSHLWLIWGFNNVQKGNVQGTKDLSWSPTVRPPRLGGNKRMGVFATRSPFRPNPLGLSSVRLMAIEGNTLIVSGADLLDGTPIYDIKPYLSFSDSHPDASDGFAEETKDYHLKVDWSAVIPVSLDNGSRMDREWNEYCLGLERSWYDDVTYILGQDPRPAYQDDPNRVYKLEYAGWRVVFTVQAQVVIVRKIEKVM